MSDPKHGGNLGPNDPAYYAPRELAGNGPRAGSRCGAQAGRRVASAADDGRPAAANAGQSSPNAVRVPRCSPRPSPRPCRSRCSPRSSRRRSVLRDASGRRAPVQRGAQGLDRGGPLRQALRRFSSWPSRRRQRPATDTSSLSATWQQVKSSVLPAPPQPQLAHRDLGRPGGQRARQRCAAARDSRGRLLRPPSVPSTGCRPGRG